MTVPPVATLLRISLTAAGSPQQPGAPAWNRVEGGPEALLRWLEARLGLGGEPVPVTSRITQFAARLASVGPAAWSASLDVDRWATAKELLARRDELRLCGWDGRDHPLLPPLARDLARVEASPLPLAPGIADRIAQVIAAVDAGQRLPPHRIELRPEAPRWPVAWQRAFERLELAGEPSAAPSPAPRAAAGPASPESPNGSSPLAPAGSSLRAVQEALVANAERTVPFDDSLRWLGASGPSVAVDGVAALLASLPPELVAESAIVCPNPDLALAVDAALARRGVPTAGAASSTACHPAIQVLPLALRMLRAPVDPDELLAFLTLPIGPIPRSAARPLAKALTENPGLGSRSWTAAFDKLTSSDDDPDGKLRATLDGWLMPPRTPRDRRLPSSEVAAVARKVAAWAMGRSAFESRRDEFDLADALAVVSSQASSFAELVELQGSEIDEPQMARLLDAVEAGGLPIRPFPAAAGGPLLVPSLAGLERPVRIAIWLGLSSADPAATRWTVTELDALRAAGVGIDDGSAALAAASADERRGLGRIRERLLAISLGSDGESRPHPLWLRVASLFEKVDGEAPKPVPLAALLRGEGAAGASPWRFPTAETPVEPPPAPRATWPVDPLLFRAIDRVSASSLETRLACPLKWVLRYPASLQEAPIARLPTGGRMRGTFLHSVLETVLGASAGGPLPGIDETVAAVGKKFDERLPLDAAPLDALSQRLDKARLRAHLLASVRVLLDALGRGGYRIVGLEVPVEGTVLGQPLAGWIDCLAVTDDGEEAVIDFKFAGARRYRESIAAGRSTQLATYAKARANVVGHDRVRAAYLAMAGATLVTPEGGPLRAAPREAQVPGAPAILEVWDRFEAALDAADAWLAGTEPVTARPLLPPDKWPPGAELVLDGADDAGDEPACNWCEYPVLCGRQEVR